MGSAGGGREVGVVQCGSCYGAPSHAGGLALLADRWPVDLSPQFVLLGSPASSLASLPPSCSGDDSGGLC